MLEELEFFLNGKNKTLVSSLTIRVFDLLFSGISLFLVLPAFVLIVLLIKISSPGSVITKVQFLGRNKLPFNLLKFRCTIVNDTSKNQDNSPSNKSQCTPIGKFLLRIRLNNIPMLINVLLGQMSIVGPRLFSPNDIKLLSPEQQKIFKVRPGIINPSSSLISDPDYWEDNDGSKILSQELAYDFDYLKNRTLWSDIKFILKSTLQTISSSFYKNSILQLRNRHFFVIDIIFILIIPALATLIRLDSLNQLNELYPALLFFAVLALIIKLSVFYYSGLYRRYWQYASVGDLAVIFISTFIATVILTTILFALHKELAFYKLVLPRSIPFIDFLLTFFIIGGIRVGLRGMSHLYKNLKVPNWGKRVMIVGAGEAGAMIVRELRNNPNLNFKPVVFADDDITKVNRNIQGLPVAGTTENIPEIVEKFNIKQIIVAMPSLPLATRRKIIDKCKSTNVPTDSLPGVYEILAGYKTISRFPEIDINLLLHRKPIVINHSKVSDSLKGSTVLVTGAGGSIGSELCRQIACFNPKEILLLGHGENSIFEIGLDLRLTAPGIKYHQIIADIRNYKKMMWIFNQYRPDVVFHAAAHKHVPLMENNVEEAISNNILGTQNVLLAAKRFNVKRFVLISTDKAIRPKNIMGATKHIAELLIRSVAKNTGRPYMAVRFGNVLGSRGSVIPIFQRQIAAGGPVTITHKEMTRYFMTIPEACQLVLQASVLGHNGDLFVLDMGDPVRIKDLAESLIRLSGLEPERDIKIEYTGIRPGEKLHEELFERYESYQTTKHEEIFVVNNHIDIDENSLINDITELLKLAEQMKYKLAKTRIEAIIQKYQNQDIAQITSKNQLFPPRMFAFD